ncbi:hypothetical protein I5677_00045 [Mobilitalea sibirica]|uniref:BIG2 domain-containing protein n=1 Tax=Mobilitalea sibirica TaxID=1462919 RepID=A0A8J7KRG9_9FIRM|nr:Ig-like domain-containing protein [Mobilitalea sibirica]MBH1939276.1 hypothetical protein [Mobilitalea sibirica]
MKMSQGKRMAMILVLILMVSFWWNQSEAVVSAATPTFVKSTVELKGEGETYQHEIKNKVAGSTYKWSSSNTKVVKVSSKGLITTVGKGTATVKCKIIYPSGKSKTISSKVKVIVPATGIKINNAEEVNGAHILTLGEEYNFNRDIFPSGSSDKTYWSIGGGDAGCIKVNSSNGVVNAVKAGKVILVATAAETSSQEAAENSIVNDAIIIEVIGPSATVKSAEIVGSTELKVVFDSPIDKSTVIGADNKLLNSIEVTMKKNVKGVLAKDPGTLTASLSSDLKTLTITSSNMFDGEYGINFTNKIKTTDGLAIEEYYKQLNFIDTIPPSITEVDLDDTGMIATIRFNEAVDFSDFKVSNAALVPTGSFNSSVEPSTLSTLNNKLNYIASEDKKSLTINLSKIAVTDYGKTFSITMTGIKDLSGNMPSSYTLTTYLLTDTAPKPQARPIMILRTSYNTITATFDRAIQQPGWARLNNGSTLYGTVDEKDNKKVNYALTDADATLTGIQTVSIGYWNSYNVTPTDTYAQQMHSFSSVNFSVDKTNPVLLTSVFDPETNVLTLTYNKEVTLTANSGIFSSILVTITDEIRSGTNITYTKMESAESNVIKLLMGNMTLSGNYTFTIEQGFVQDNFRNLSLSRSITISNTGGTTNELPGPYAIIQSTTNLSQIYLEFANMLDVTSAQTVANYSIPGVVILTAQVTKNTKDNGATVLLTVADGSIDVTVERPVSISGVKGYNGSFSEIVEYTTTVELKDNKKPIMIDQPVFDKNAMNVIRLNFNEPIQGDMDVKVTQIGTYPIEYTSTVSVSGNSVYITLGSVPGNNTYLRIEILENNITDMSGNQSANIQTQLGVMVSY